MTVLVERDPRGILRAVCCREWPVLGLNPMGKCGYCKQVPEVMGPWKD